MVDDHRQYFADLIARWAELEGDEPFYFTSVYGPNHMAYRLADVIVSNPYAGQGVELEVPAEPVVPYLDHN